MNTHSPIPLRASKSAISDFAEKVAARLRFPPGSPIEPLVTRLGGKISYSNPRPSDGRLPESIVVRSKSDFTIFLPTMTSQERDRFTIAHELGHLFLHYPLVAREYPGAEMVATRWVDETNADLARTEWEANWFAAALLMPTRDFGAIYRIAGLSGIGAKFKVSAHAARIRARSLGFNAGA